MCVFDGFGKKMCQLLLPLPAQTSNQRFVMTAYCASLLLNEWLRLSLLLNEWLRLHLFTFVAHRVLGL